MPAEADVLLDQTFHALADVSRRSILVRLSRCPPSVSELAEPVAMSLPTVVPHLDVLQGPRRQLAAAWAGPHLPARAGPIRAVE
jgi:DNA-binding transcriptional ArsR family regulator